MPIVGKIIIGVVITFSFLIVVGIFLPDSTPEESALNNVTYDLRHEWDETLAQAAVHPLEKAIMASVAGLLVEHHLRQGLRGDRARSQLPLSAVLAEALPWSTL